jgi:hypothetical protein
MWIPAGVIPGWLAPDDGTRHAAARLAASLAACAVLVLCPQLPAAVAAWADAGCLLRGLTGLPCPGCGITTSLLALARGDMAAAWTANPAGVAVAVLLAGQAMIAAPVLVRRAAAAAVSPRFTWFVWLDRLALGGLLAAWVGRLIFITA